jgi:uncharacterized membrane protein
MGNQAKHWLLAIGICAMLLCAAYGVYKIGRWLQYTFGYESQVKASICEMVKPEYLKQPCD